VVAAATKTNPWPALSHLVAVQVRHPGAIQIPIPMITSDTTITNRLIVSQVGMRFAGCWVIAGPSATRSLCRTSATSCEYGHMPLGIHGMSHPVVNAFGAIMVESLH
jgi:hypothetical protein